LIFLAFVSLSGLDGPLTPRIGLVLDPIPEETGLYMEYICSLNQDEQGRFYGLDLRAKTVFVWDRSGKYLRNFGEPGMGPGQFSFTEDSIASTYATVVNNRYYVFESHHQIIDTFTLDGTFVERQRFRGNGGLAWNFASTKSGNFIIQQVQVFSKDPGSDVRLYDAHFKELAMLSHVGEKSFIPNYRNGKFEGYVVHAFAARQIAYSDPSNNEIIVGNNLAPEFDIFDNNGKKIRTIKYNTSRREVTKEDRNEFKMQELGPYVLRIQFPNEHPWYDFITPAAGKRYLIFNMSPVHRNLRGLMVDASGKIHGRLNYSLGEEGKFFAVSGRVFVNVLDIEDEYKIQELIFDSASSKDIR